MPSCFVALVRFAIYCGDIIDVFAFFLLPSVDNIGGFGVALEALGGKCLFVSEIDENCRETYMTNFDTPPEHVHGNIYEVNDSDFPDSGSLDLLV